MTEAMGCYGNPSSLHSVGLAAQKIVDDARNALGHALGVRMPKPGQLVFTASGTEANNLAIRGSIYSKSRRVANKIITTDSEHPSVDALLSKLEEDGFRVVRISTRGGVLDMAAVERELDKDVLLVTMMMVNNETGALYDVEKVFRMAKMRCPEAVTHCDAVQGFMKVKFTPSSIAADLVSVSSHKIHGPKGVGALYISADILKQRRMSPIVFGGGQESGFRSGTENVIGIAGFGAAVREAYMNLDAHSAHMQTIREYTLLKLSALEVRLNTPIGATAPHIVNFTLPNIKSETMLHYLSGEGIYVSSGSACSSHSHTPSRALTAFGLSANDADCSLRVSLSDLITESDIDSFVERLEAGIRVLVRIKR
jgi:cysteine desulfurase